MKTTFRDAHAVEGLELRDAPAESKGVLAVLTGYASVFNRDSLTFTGWDKPWVERIAPGAFKRSLDESPDVVALWSHDPASPIARAPDGGLSVREDEKGLRVEISIPDTSVGRDVVANVRAKIVRGMSFGFQPVKTEWDTSSKERDIRTIKEARLFEVSPVVWPAYPDTSISARATVNDLDQVKAERDAHNAEANRSSAPVSTPQRDLWAARLGKS